MSPTHVEVEGTLQPDGNLVLDEKPNLPPGRVRVVLLPVEQPTPVDQFWAGMKAIWAGQKARGYVPRSKEEIDAEVRALRDEAEDEMRAVEQIHFDAEAERQGRQPGGQSG